jgi:hypothetical protein
MRFKFTSELTGHYSNQVEITIDLIVNFKGISPVAVDASIYSMKTSYML